jgi:hypothetical protein
MKEYVTPSIELWQLGNQDVVTASDPNDNNYGDIDWGN